MKKYNCPYCNIKATRGDLVNHVGSAHEVELPEEYTPARAVYDAINNKNYGTCMICGSRVYSWNDKVCKYNNLCESDNCRKKVREIAVGRNMRVYNKPHLLGDPNRQTKMLANRRISGKYTFQDGGIKTYTGSYERKALEFWDKFMNIPSNDIECPGPILTYEYNGETLTWITDQFYIPGKLVIEVKDGGSNPNNRTMVSYREKQLAKEKMITELGTFNYLRLTDNDFSQIMEMLADIKLEEIENDKPKRIFHINEGAGMPGGTMPRQGANDMSVIIPYENLGNLAFAYSDDDAMNNLLTLDGDTNKIMKNDPKQFFENHPLDIQLIPTKCDRRETLRYIAEHRDEPKSFLFFIEAICGHKLSCFEQVLTENMFRYVSAKDAEMIDNFSENAIVHDAIDSDSITEVNNSGNGFVSIGKDIEGFFAFTPRDFYLVSPHYKSRVCIQESMIKTMNRLYKNNRNKRGEHYES